LPRNLFADGKEGRQAEAICAVTKLKIPYGTIVFKSGPSFHLFDHPSDHFHVAKIRVWDFFLAAAEKAKIK